MKTCPSVSAGNPLVVPPSRGLSRRSRWALIVMVILAALLFVRIASATPTFVNPCSADLDPGVCERVDYLANQSDSVIEDLHFLIGVGLFIGVAAVMFETFSRRN